MKTINFFIAGVVATGFLFTTEMRANNAHAGDAAAGFIGGVVTSKILNNMNRRTRAEEHRAYNTRPRQTTVPQPIQAPAAPVAPKSTKERLDQLDTLAANGYITPEEYKQKRQAIINGL